jgi:hypothetical protein
MNKIMFHPMISVRNPEKVLFISLILFYQILRYSFAGFHSISSCFVELIITSPKFNHSYHNNRPADFFSSSCYGIFFATLTILRFSFALVQVQVGLGNDLTQEPADFIFCNHFHIRIYQLLHI